MKNMMTENMVQNFCIIHTKKAIIKCAQNGSYRFPTWSARFESRESSTGRSRKRWEAILETENFFENNEKWQKKTVLIHTRELHFS